MTSQIGARLVLGGRTSGQAGLYPGVAEEAALALAQGVPLFVAGGFGGCGGLIARALRGGSPKELTRDYQRTHTRRYDELSTTADRAGHPPDFEAMVRGFGAAGPSGLRNGLEPAENARLFETGDIDEMLSLVLAGLQRLTA